MDYNAQFFLDKEKEKSDAKVRFRIKWEGETVAFSLGYRVEIEKWSTDTQRCRINTTHGKKKVPANIINRKIQRYRDACDQVFKEYELKNTIPSRQEFRDDFKTGIGKKKKTKSKQTNLFSAYDAFLKEESIANQWALPTKNKLGTVKKRLKKFDKDLTFGDLNERGLQNYQHFLQIKVKFRNSTIKKEFELLKWFLAWAKRKGYHTNNDFEYFKPKLKTVKKKIIFLTQEDLEKLREYTIPVEKEYLERVRDVFLFQCFTGLRYSDVANLKRSDVKEDHIEITTVKTHDALIIELNKHSRRILEKYKEQDYRFNKALPVISNQRMNDYLKELSLLAGIDEPIRQTYYQGNQRIDHVQPKWSLISTHAGRRTFICNALSLGIPPQVVMKWTGHSDYKSMKPYIDIADKIKSNAMDKFNLL